MALIVQKFGGSSVADAQRVSHVAGIISNTYRQGNQVVVVVSAQGKTTDHLIAQAQEVNPNPSKRELDALMATGELASMALMALALERLGMPAISLSGWQAGIHTDSTHGAARVSRIDTERLRNELDKGNIVIVAGFQGVNKYEDITTLGRGGCGYQCCGTGSSPQCGSLPDLHRCGWRLYCRSPDRAQCHQDR